MSARAVTAAQELEVAARYEDGESVTDLAFAFRCSNKAIRAVLGRQGVTLRHVAPNRGVPGPPSISRRATSPEQDEEIARLYTLEGVSTERLAEKFGCARKTIILALKRTGVDLQGVNRPLVRYPMEYMKSLGERWEAGESVRHIAIAEGVSDALIRRLIRDGGTKIYPRPNPPAPRGPNSPFWRGGRVKLGDYIAVKVDRDDEFYYMSNNEDYVLEHRLVYARATGIKLTSAQSIHHINGIKTDNRIENLQLRVGQHGTGEYQFCGCCGSVDLIEEALPESV